MPQGAVSSRRLPFLDIEQACHAKLIIHSPARMFDAADRQRVAASLTALGLDCEALPFSPMVRSTVWTYFAKYAADAVFMGDQPARIPVVTLQICVLAGGLDGAGKRRRIEGATAILDRLSSSMRPRSSARPDALIPTGVEC